jgi:hypothetical protein
MDENQADQEINEAIVVYLRRYPNKNDDEFDQSFGDDASLFRERVREILSEAMRSEVDWDGLTLVEGGEAIKSIMAAKHPNLSEAALTSLGHYYTFLMR